MFAEARFYRPDDDFEEKIVELKKFKMRNAEKGIFSYY
jgi:hypothetical protein